MPTGFIFDLDGVIVDTAKYHFKAWQSLAKNLQYNFTEQDNEQFKGISRVRSLELLLEMAQYKATEKEKEQWLIDKNTHYLSLISNMNNSEILPGITEILKALKAQQIPVALGSASKNAQPILEKVGLLSYFDVLVDGNEVTMAKPNPEVFLTAAKGLGVAPEDCVVFEDAQAGVAAAKAAKMTCVGIGDPAILFNADHCFASTAEITPSFVQSLIA
jgi:beta-phosphoglucomutase